MSKKEKFVLELDDLEEDYFDEVSMLAIVCKEEAYHFIWHCNKLLNKNFLLYKGIPADHALVNYPIYDFYNNKNALQHYIFQLHHKQEKLLPELKNFDFLWLIQGGNERFVLQEKIIETLPQFNKVQAVAKVQSASLKNKALLII